MTAMLYAHLNKTKGRLKKLLIHDKRGIPHLIDLDSTEFLLQRKATMVRPYLLQLIESGEIDKAKAQLHKLIRLIAQRHARGISDSDAGFGKNFGFIGDEPVQIDVGTFMRGITVRGRNFPPEMISEIVKEPKRFPSLSIISKNKEFRQWLVTLGSNELAETYDSEVNELLDEGIF